MVDHGATWLVSGAFAGMSVDLVLFPIDTLKTRLQSPGRFAGRNIWRGLFQGISPALFVSGPNAAVFFYTYEHMKVYLQKTDIASSYTQSLLASCAAELVYTFLYCFWVNSMYL